jgi:hypothetical protein
VREDEMDFEYTLIDCTTDLIHGPYETFLQARRSLIAKKARLARQSTLASAANPAKQLASNPAMTNSTRWSGLRAGASVHVAPPTISTNGANKHDEDHNPARADAGCDRSVCAITEPHLLRTKWQCCRSFDNVEQWPNPLLRSER